MTLRELRQSQQLSLDEMAIILGKSRGSLSAYENGKTKIPDEVYERVVEHFQVDIREETLKQLEAGPKQGENTITGEELKSLRLAHYLSQKQLADIIGKSPSSVINYEKGVGKVPADAAMRLEKWLKNQPAVSSSNVASHAAVPASAEKSDDVQETGTSVSSPVREEDTTKEELEKKETEKEDAKKEVEKEETKKEAEKEEAKKEVEKEQTKKEAKQKETKNEEKEESKEKLPHVFIQAQSGSTISVEEVVNRVQEVVPTVDNIYVKPEENRAYWTAGKHNGSTLLW